MMDTILEALNKLDDDEANETGYANTPSTPHHVKIFGDGSNYVSTHDDMCVGSFDDMNELYMWAKAKTTFWSWKLTFYGCDVINPDGEVEFSFNMARHGDNYQRCAMGIVNEMNRNDDE